MLRRIQPLGADGGALVYVLVIVLMVAGLAASLLQLNSAFSQRQAGSRDLKEAFYIAEAGLTESFAGLTIGKTGNVGTEEVPAVFGDGLLWVRSEDLGNDLVRLDSTGLAGSARAILSSVVQRGTVSVATLGVFAGEPLAVPPGSRIDGYNSDESPYHEVSEEDLAAFAGGRLGSNGSVKLSGTQQQPTTVHGDVKSGPGQTVQTSTHVVVSGALESARVTRSLPPVTSPPIALAAAVVHDGELPLLIPPGTTGLESLRVGAHAEVQILGPALLRFGSLQVDPEGKLVLDNSAGAIQIHVDEGLALAQGSLLEVRVPDPGTISVLVAGAGDAPLSLSAAGEFHGVLYAPLAEVELASPFEIFGALVARHIEFLGPTVMHFDQALLDAANSTALPTLVSWRILELGQEPGIPPGGSPFEYLGLDRELLPSPAEAHHDQQLQITYLDASDTLKTYNGLESAFDWGDVAEPLTVLRGGQLVPTFEEPGTVALAAPAAPVTPALQALLDAIADTNLNSSAIRDVLLAEAPVPEQALLAAYVRSPAMGSSHLRDVLQASYPLSEAALEGMLETSGMSTGDLMEILEDSSPLPPSLLQVVINTASLVSQDLRDILIENSPLPLAAVTQLTLRLPPMNPVHLLAVLGAQ